MIQKYLLMILCALNIHRGERCNLNSRIHFDQPLPIIIRNGRLLEPTDKFGNVILEFGETLTLSCEGVGAIYHPNKIRDEATATIICGGGENFHNNQWLNSMSSFSDFRCSDPPNHASKRTDRTCFQGNPIYEVGYTVQGQFYALYESCFNERTLNAMYSKYTQRPFNAKYQTRVDRPYFVANDVYGVAPVESLFSPRGQKSAVQSIVGNIANEYITDKEFLSRGHLAAKTDFAFAFGERGTFHYVNCAPQWYGFNSGNWNTLEVDLRNYIHEADVDTIIYTGTYGVTQLFNDYGQRVDIHLYSDHNNNPVIPVPLYYYKVVYDAVRKRGIVFIGINGPYYTAFEAENLFFCENICKRSSEFHWLSWHPHNPREGYTFCCTVPDFRNTVTHLPSFEVNSIFR